METPRQLVRRVPPFSLSSRLLKKKKKRIWENYLNSACISPFFPFFYTTFYILLLFLFSLSFFISRFYHRLLKPSLAISRLIVNDISSYVLLFVFNTMITWRSQRRLLLHFSKNWLNKYFFFFLYINDSRSRRILKSRMKSNLFVNF